MASYDYRCKECDLVKLVSHSMKDSPEIKCESCEGEMQKMIPKSLTFNLKGSSWSGKNIKEKSYREKRNKEMGRRMAKSHDIPQIQPNYKGEVVDNWDTAKKLAKDDGVDPLRYQKQVDNLTSQKTKIDEKRQKLLKGET